MSEGAANVVMCPKCGESASVDIAPAADAALERTRHGMSARWLLRCADCGSEWPLVDQV